MIIQHEPFDLLRHRGRGVLFSKKLMCTEKNQQEKRDDEPYEFVGCVDYLIIM